MSRGALELPGDRRSQPPPEWLVVLAAFVQGATLGAAVWSGASFRVVAGLAAASWGIIVWRLMTRRR